MKLRRNIIANYASQAYSAAAGILTVPAYVKYMGAEAYGLVGFYGLLQAWFLILDAGLSTTLSREVARYNGGATSAATLVQLKRLLELLFAAVGVLGAVVFYVAAPSIATHWLQVSHLNLDDVIHSIQLMGVVITLRWMSCLYRGVITGFENQVWLSGFNLVVTTLRFVVSIPVVAFVDSRLTTFFAYQAAVSALEVALLMQQSSRLMPRPGATTGGWDWSVLRPAMRFASGVAFTSVIWVLVTQVDKLALSKLLPLGRYGEFTLAVLLAGGINLLSGPISTALVPRLTNLASSSGHAEVERLYRRFTQIVCTVTVPAALTLFFFSKEILFAWTGNAGLAANASTILGLYALGNAVLSIAAFPYYLQYARGDLRLHLIGNGIFVVFYLPMVLLATQRFSAEGAAWAWVIMNLLYLLAWIPLIHARLAPGLHYKWLLHDVARIALAACVPFAASPWFRLSSEGPFSNAAVAICYGALSLACAVAASRELRKAVLGMYRNAPQAVI